MKNKILLVVGIGIGYELGARAGRESYDRIAATAGKFWNSPRVQKRVTSAEDFVKDKAPDVADFLADGAKRVVRQVSGAKAPAKARAKTPAKTTTTSTRSTSTTT